MPPSVKRHDTPRYVKCFPVPPTNKLTEEEEDEGSSRRASVAAWVYESLGQDGVAALSDSQRAMLGLQDYP